MSRITLAKLVAQAALVVSVGCVADTSDPTVLDETGAVQPYDDEEDVEQEEDKRRKPRPTPDAGTPTPTQDAGTPTQDAGTPPPPTPAPSGRWVAGYYAAYQRSMLPPSEIDWSGLSHIILTRLKTDGTGRVLLDFDIDNVNGPALAREISTRAHQAGKKAILMLGGAGQGSAIRSSASSANRATFVTNLLNAVKDLGFDGLDLDWEDSMDYDSFIALAQALRASSNAPAGMILTAPGGPINPNIETPNAKIPALVQYLDQYNLMSYYPATAVAGWGWLSWHNSPLSGWKGNTPVTIQDSLARYVAMGIPKAKLGMGIGFYAICYTGGITAPNQSTEGGVTIQGGDNNFPLSSLFATGGVYNANYRRWDATAQNSYLSLPYADARGCRYISYEDQQSIAAKGAFTRTNGYGGTIVWTINQGWLRNGVVPANTLMQALKAGFLDP